MGSTGPDSSSSTIPTTPTAEELKLGYTSARGQDARISDVIRVLEAIIQRDAQEDLTTEEIRDSISALSELVLANTKQINYLHLLIAKLVLTIIENDLEVDDKELINEMNAYLGIK